MSLQGCNIVVKKSFKILSLNMSTEKGTVKKPVNSVTFVDGLGIEGDAHAAPGDRQVSLLADEDIKLMQAKSADIVWGDFAENITTSGVVLHKLPIGTKLYLGDTILEVSKIGKECHHDCEVYKKIGSCIMPKRGIFASVLKGGTINVKSNCYYS